MVYRTVLYIGEAYGCTHGFLSGSVINTISKNDSNDDIGLLRGGEIRLFPDMTFNCNGTIYGVYLSGRNKGCCTNDLYPSLQLYRNSSNNARYRLISTHTIQPTSLSTTSNGGYYYYYKFTNPIQHAVNDVIGVYQPTNDDCFQLSYTISTVNNHPISYSTIRKANEDTDTSLNINRMTLNRGHTLLLRPKYSKYITIIIITIYYTYCMLLGGNCLSTCTSLSVIKSNTVSSIITRSNDGSTIYPNIKFKCDGYINSWIVAINNTSMRTHIQVWRPLGDDKYSLINYTQLINGHQYMNNPNMYMYRLRNPILIKCGDVVGVVDPERVILYQEHAGNIEIINNNINSTCGRHYPLITVEYSKLVSSTHSGNYT